MTSPVTWAAGSFAMLAIAATFAGQRLAKLGDAGRPAGVAEPSSVAARQGSGPSAADRTLVVYGDRRGHFRVSATVEGRHAFMLVDTGATIVALTFEDALAAGIRPRANEFTRAIGTANGVVSVAPVQLRELRVGDITVRDVDAVVVPQGRLGTSLLGMSFLRGLRGFEVAGNRLTLKG